jgi:uncharacterized membrane protein YjgN (DUF898 family)
MRYLVAMLVAIAAAALATVYVSSPVASWVVRQYTFDSPDTVASLHAATFMACNLAALVLGFLIGWGLGRPFARQ